MDKKLQVENKVWKILKKYFVGSNLINHQIDSFNEFITHTIKDINKDQNEIKFKIGTNRYIITFGDIYVENPSLLSENDGKIIYPNEIRKRNLHYEAVIYCDINETIIDKDNKVENKPKLNRVKIGRIPIMVGSVRCNLMKLSKNERIKKDECKYDEGGYFLLKGNERVLVCQLRNNYNTISVIKQKKKDKYKYIAALRSMSISTGHSVATKMYISKDGKKILTYVPHMKELIPIGLIFKCYGYINKDDISKLIGKD